MNPLVKFALGLANVPETDVAALEKSLPALARLCRAAKQLDPIVREAWPHITPLEPLAEKALAIIEAAAPDVVAVLPTLEEFIAFVNARQG